MATPSTSGGDGGLLRCGDCGARLACDQRYCVECGARRGPLQPAVAQLIGAAAAGVPARSEPTEDELAAEQASARLEIPLPSPLVAGLAVLALLAMGVLLKEKWAGMVSEPENAVYLSALRTTLRGKNHPV